MTGPYPDTRYGQFDGCKPYIDTWEARPRKGNYSGVD